MIGVKIKKCPICGSKKIRRVRRDLKIDVGDLHFTTPNLSFNECPNCGEQFFDLAAMQKIESHRPAAGPKVRSRRSA
jgi:YgiT-type zinc finger domain-containing protein